VIPRNLQITAILLVMALIAGGVYMYQLKRRDERNAMRMAVDNARPVTAPVSGPKTLVRLAIAYDDDGVVAERESEVPLPADANERAREILRALLAEYLQKPSPHPIGDGTDVRAVYFVAGGLCVVDMNTAFAEGHRSGVLLEQYTVATMVETLGRNIPGVRRVKFLVDGKDRETLAGHADLNAIYDVASVHELVAGLEEH
jgi:Sporulation and spore germination